MPPLGVRIAGVGGGPPHSGTMTSCHHGGGLSRGRGCAWSGGSSWRGFAGPAARRGSQGRRGRGGGRAAGLARRGDGPVWGQPRGPTDRETQAPFARGRGCGSGWLPSARPRRPVLHGMAGPPLPHLQHVAPPSSAGLRVSARFRLRRLPPPVLLHHRPGPLTRQAEEAEGGGLGDGTAASAFVKPEVVQASALAAGRDLERVSARPVEGVLLAGRGDGQVGCVEWRAAARRHEAPGLRKTCGLPREKFSGNPKKLFRSPRGWVEPTTAPSLT